MIKGKIKNRIASGLGCLLEWYDFSLYGFFAPVLAEIFFTQHSKIIATLQVFIIYAIGFIVRPLGSLFLGSIADYYGRVKLLKITPLLITIPTFLIAVLPSYQQINIFAPIILLILRIMQGFCIGGEFANNIIYLCESTVSQRNYLTASIANITGSIGIFLGSAVTTLFYVLFSHQDLLTYGWRIAFGSSLLVGLLIFFLRIMIPKEQQNTEKVFNPLIESLKHQKSDYLKVLGLTYLSATAYYFVFIFLPNFGHHYLSINLNTSFLNNTIAILLHLFLTILLAILTDKIGGLTMTRLACLLFITFSFPIFYLFIHCKNYFNIFICLFSILTAFNTASLCGLLIKILKKPTRCTVFAFSFNLGYGVFGGLTPLIAFYIINKSGWLIAPVFYLMLSAGVTLITSFFVKIN